MPLTVIIKPGDPDFYEPVSERDARGYIEEDGQEVAATLQCVHCGCHWIPMRGSGRIRGFCMNCMGVHCGSEACSQPCSPGASLHWERQMEKYERAHSNGV